MIEIVPIAPAPDMKSAASFPVGTVLVDSSDDMVVKISDDVWIDRFSERMSNSELESWVSEPVVIFYQPKGDN